MNLNEGKKLTTACLEAAEENCVERFTIRAKLNKNTIC